MAAPVAKSVLDGETVVVERLRRDAEEGRGCTVCRNERLAEDIAQPGLVLSECCEVDARSVAAETHHPTNATHIQPSNAAAFSTVSDRHPGANA